MPGVNATCNKSEESVRILADQAARNTRSRVTTGLGLQVVRASVHDDGAANDTVLTGTEADAGHADARFRNAIAIRLNIAEIATVAHFAVGSAVSAPMRIEMPTGAACVGCAAIAFFMYVNAVRCVRG